MADLATLQVRVEAQAAIRNSQMLGDALTKTGKAADAVSLAAGKTEAQIRRLQLAEAAAYREAERMASGQRSVAQNIENVASTVRGGVTALSAFAGAMALREYANFADTMTLVTARLRLVTKSSEDLAYVQEALFNSAQKTRTGFEETAGLYVRVARNMDTLGKSEQELLKFAELVNMELQIAGATTQEASAGVMQLGQALSKGKLDGDEFRTVLEAMPTVADKLTKSLAGGVRAELFAMAKQGRITGADIVSAMLQMEKETTAAFSKMPRTISGAWTQSKNDILKAIGEIDTVTKGSSFLQILARAPGILAQSLADPFRILNGEASREEAERRKRQEEGNVAYARRLRLQTTPEGRQQLEQERRDQQATEEANRQRILAEAEKKARDERYQSFLQERRQADERKQWELDEINRQQRILDARMAARGGVRAPSGAAVDRLATAGFGGTSVGLATMAITRDPTTMLFARLQQDMARLRDQEIRQQRQASAEKMLLEVQMNEEIAANFRENIQRSLGDFFTAFVQTGRLSIQSLFQGISGVGANIAGQGLSQLITNMLPASMGPVGSILSGLGLAGIGSLFGRRNRPSGPTAEERLAQAQGRYASIETLRQQRAEEMRQFMEGRNGAASRGVVQSIGTVLQETTASRMIGELVAIRVATRQTADAVRGTGAAAMGGTTVNVTVQGGAMATGQDIGEKVAEAVDRLLGTKVQTLRLTSGAAVVQ